MKFKKLRKVYRVFFPKKFSKRDAFEYKLKVNPLIKNYKIVDCGSYKLQLENNLEVIVRNESHSDYQVFEQVFNDKQYEIFLSLLDCNFSDSQGHFIIDAGANVGFTSLYFYEHFNLLTIYAVEPSENNIAICNKNFELNDACENLILFKNALAHKVNQRFIVGNDFRDSKDWAITTEESDEGKIKGVTIKELIEGSNFDVVSLLKIDIEGAERYIFNNESDHSFLKKVRTIAIEIHDEFNIRSSIYSILKSYNFVIFDIGELTVGVNKSLS